MKQRISRTRRRAGVKVVLGPRDQAVLRAVGRFRLCRSSDLLELFFQARRDTALRRLRRLHDSGFLEARVTALHEENAFALGPAGRAFVEAEGLIASLPPSGAAEHHLALVKLWSRLAVAVAGRVDLRLVRFLPDWEIRRELAGTDPRLVPDAFIELLVGDGTINRWALEVDLGQERAAELRKKLLAYSAETALNDEPRGLAMVLCGACTRRRALVTGLVQELWTGAAVVCLQDDWPQAVLSVVSGSAKTPLAGSPYGNGRGESVSPGRDGETEPQGEVHLR